MGTVSQSEACSTSFESSVPIVSSKKGQDEEADVINLDGNRTLLKQRGRRRRSLFVGSSSEDDADVTVRAVRRKCSVNYYESDSCSEGEAVLESPSPVVGWRSKAGSPSLTLPQGVSRGCPDCSTCQKVVARWRPDAGHHFSLAEAPCFYPTEEEFKDTLKYLSSIRSEAEQYGIVRIVPPPSWKPSCLLRSEDPQLQDLLFPTRVQKVHQLQSRNPVFKVSPAVGKQVNGRKKRKSKYGSVGRCRKNPQGLPMGRMKGQVAGPAEHSEFFGFEPGTSFKLKDFEAYANEFKSQYFEREDPEAKSQISDGVSSKWDPPLEAIEGEYWRIVESATEQIEVLYGADVETASYCSGFPKQETPCVSGDPDPYASSSWNLNNIAKSPGSILAFEEGNISGVQVPWLYVGMCFSSFCWHVEDHHFYSLNYLHFGEPKIWYGVPGHAAHQLEEVMKKKLPDLFAEQPDLLHKLVTQLSPAILREEGVPVFKVKQRPREFVVTMPRAYHSGFNCGFNCAEAVNVAPVDWLPHGQSAVELYRKQLRKTSVSHDKLLIAAAWHAVKTQWGAAARVEDKAKCTWNPWKESCGPDSLLAKALKTRVEMERKRQGSLKGDVFFKPMDQSFDATDERECFYCHYDLHLSAVGCACCPEKYACLEHTLDLCSCPWGSKFVLCRVDLSSLEMLLAAVEGKPNYVMAVIKWQKMQNEQRVALPQAKAEGMAHSGLVSNKSRVTNNNNNNNTCRSTQSCHQGSNVYLQQIDDFFAAKLRNEVRLKEKAGGGQDDRRHVTAEVSRPSPIAGSQVVANGKANGCQSPLLALLQPAGGGIPKYVGSDGRQVRISSQEQQPLPASRLIFSSDASRQGSKPMVVGEGRFQQYLPQDADGPSTSVQSAQLFDMPRVDRHGGPRVAKVVRLRKNLPDAELLSVGVLVPRTGYHDKTSIFPAGFKSRRQFPSIVNPSETSYYESEIVDGFGGPIFKVTLAGHAVEPFISTSIDGCWQRVQEQLNSVIMQLRAFGRTNLPPLQPPESIQGLQMFGFCSPAITHAVESLDPHHLCTEYWAEKMRRLEQFQRVVGLQQHHNNVSGESLDKSVSSISLKSVNTEVGVEAVLRSRSREMEDIQLLQGLFKKATMSELQALERLFKGGKEGVGWNVMRLSLLERLEASE